VTSQRVNDGHIKPLFIEYEIDHMVTLSGPHPTDTGPDACLNINQPLWYTTHARVVISD
jgi:hypothetical protein